MQNTTVQKHGLLWGLIIGLVYCVLLYLKFEVGATSPLLFGMLSFVGFIIVLVLLLISGFSLRKKLGGYIELKDAFKALFISVLVFELFYAIFNFIYLKYINPDFFAQLKNATEVFLQKAKQSQAQIDKTINAIDVDAPRKMTIWDVLKSYLFYVAISGICAFLIALIIKRTNPEQRAQQQFIQDQV